ncbi:GNAT family N-acetyltransferase [Olleya sp. R77988]|uniref:GNAT family N-acetyltransferase n=1 Tax=Olleya sp. R77988 TaxID=3093875 RepID=UPI0037CC1854
MIKPFPELKTERLTLRRIEESDSNIILFLRSDKVVNKFIERPIDRQTKTTSDAVKHIKKLDFQFKNNQSVSWGITINNNPKIIGTICLWNFSEDQKTAEVGYDLIPLFQKKGIMSEALKRVINFGFTTLNFNTIEAYTDFKNKNSVKLLENNGFYVVPNKKDKDNLSNVIFEIKK